MPELMTSAVTTQNAAGTSAAVAGGTPPGASDGGAPLKSFKVSYEDGEAPLEVSLEGDGGETTDSGSKSFNFQELEPLKGGDYDALYKTLKAELSKGTRYAKHFKSPEDARDHLARIDRLAGERRDGKKGLDAVEARLRETGALIEGLQNGDKAVIEHLFAEAPEIVGDVLGHVTEILNKTDAKAGAALTAKAFVTALQQKDIYGQSALDALNAMYKFVEKAPELRPLLDRVAATVNGQSAASQYKPDTTARAARTERQFKAREMGVFRREVDVAADDIVRPAAGRALSALTSEIKGLSAEERTEMRNFLVEEFYRQMGKDAGLKAQYQQFEKTGNKDGIIALVKANRSKFMNEAAKQLYRSKLLNREAIKGEAAAKNEAGAGGTPAGGGKITVKWTGKVHPERGPMANFDFDRMNAEGIQALDRMFYVKGRKELFTW